MIGRLTTRALGRRIGVSHVSVLRWLRGRARPTPAHLAALAAELGLSERQAARLLDRATDARLDQLARQQLGR